VRTGFLEEGQLADMLAHLPDHIKPMLEIAYVTGWRRGELLSRCWQHVDLGAGWIRLEPGETKNDEGRQFPIIPRLRRVLEDQHARKVQLEREQGRIISALFFDDRGRAVTKGQLTHIWIRARTLAGHPGLLLHDCRRSAARNLIRSGVAQRVAMELTGHLTASIFQRYAIVSEDQLSQAGEQLSALYGTR
ncbi:MAG: site-specific integrase, partial [Gemmatimonadota bacterium]